MAIIYNYDGKTGEYLHASEAHIDPLDQVPMLPANATFDAPPDTVAEGNVLVFIGGAWAEVVDMRGQPYWDVGGNCMGVMTMPGNLPDGCSLTAPDPTEEELISAANAERSRLFAAWSWRVERYNSEVRLGLTPTDDIAVLDAYAQALRDVPQQEGFPGAVEWPVVPGDETEE